MRIRARMAKPPASPSATAPTALPMAKFQPSAAAVMNNVGGSMSGDDSQKAITADNGATTIAQIVNGNNQTLMGVYTIPIGKTGYVVYGKASAGKGADAKVKFFARAPGGVFTVQHAANIFQTSYDYPFSAVPAAAGMADLDVRAVTSNPAGYELTVAFDIILVDD